MNKLKLILSAFVGLTGFNCLNSMGITDTATTNSCTDYFGFASYQPMDNEIIVDAITLNYDADKIRNDIREKFEEQSLLASDSVCKSEPINYLQILYNAISDQIINSINDLKARFDVFLIMYGKQIIDWQSNTPKGKNLSYLKWPQSMQLVNNFIENGFGYKECFINNFISTHCMFCEECKAVCNWFSEGDVPNYYHLKGCKHFSEPKNAHIEQRIYFSINNNLDGLVNFRKNSEIEQSIKTALDEVHMPNELINIIAQYADDSFIEKWKTFIQLYADIRRIRTIINIDTTCGFNHPLM